MENKDSAAYPTSETTYGGLTKRELFAKAALQGLLVNAGRNGLDLHSCAAEAVKQADALLFELDKF